MYVYRMKKGRQLRKHPCILDAVKNVYRNRLQRSSIKLALLVPCCDVQAAHRRRQCSQTCSPRPPLDCLPPILSHFSRARPHRHSNQAVHQGRFIYSFNNGVSWENFGFPFPEAKIHLQNVLEIY